LRCETTVYDSRFALISRMSETRVIIFYAIVLGGSATVTMDLWAALLWRVFRVPSLDFALLGRWIGRMPHGEWVHENIKAAPPVRHERLVGWVAHYSIGIAFAAVLLAMFGLDWARRPTLMPALIVSAVTLIAPFFVMQPAMGFGVASSKAPNPNIARLRSVVTHTVYGLGLYLSARVWSLLLA
jgi:hypothetical protein